MRDLLLPYGGDITWTRQGAPAMVIDVPGNPAASQQQVTVLAMTSPRVKDKNGVGIGRADNLHYPDRGGGFSTIVGKNATPSEVAAMRNGILDGLAEKPSITQSPPPTVAFVNPNNGVLIGTINAETTGGDVLTISSSSTTTTTGG